MVTLNPAGFLVDGDNRLLYNDQIQAGDGKSNPSWADGSGQCLGDRRPRGDRKAESNLYRK